MNALLIEVGPKAYRRWLSVFWIMNSATVVALVMAIPRIEKHPMLYAFATSWIVCLVVAGVTRDRLLNSDINLFQIARWECEGRVYRWVGAAIFCWVLTHTPLGWLNPSLRLTSRKSGLEALRREINFAEGAHLLGGAITFVLIIVHAAMGQVLVSLAFALMGVLIHAIPLIVQRWNRGRIERLAHRLSSQMAKNSA